MALPSTPLRRGFKATQFRPWKVGATFLLLWRGGGILAPIIIVVAVLAVELVGGSSTNATALNVVGLLLGAVAVWFLGRTMNRRDNGVHTFLFIPMEYWAFVAVVLAIVAVLTSGK